MADEEGKQDAQDRKADGLSAGEIAKMTKQAMASAGSQTGQAPPAAMMAGAGSAAFVKYTAILLHAVFLVCIVILVWILIKSERSATGQLPLTGVVEYQREIADGAILLAYRRYDQAENRFRIAATVISELGDRQEYSGMEYSHLKAAEGGALQLAENCRLLAEADLKSTYVKGTLAMMVKAKLAMDSGRKALADKKYDEATRCFEEAYTLYEEVRKTPRYKNSRIFEQASLEAVRWQGVASRRKANAEPILPPKQTDTPPPGYDEPSAGDSVGAGEPIPGIETKVTTPEPGE